MNSLLNRSPSGQGALVADAPLPITDHAFVRWLERVRGVDVEALKAEMLSETALAAIRCGATKVSCDGMDYQIKNGKVTTVMDTKPWASTRQAKNRRRRGREKSSLERHKAES